jgi:hypothetical protein
MELNYSINEINVFHEVVIPIFDNLIAGIVTIIFGFTLYIIYTRDKEKLRNLCEKFDDLTKTKK